MAGTPLKTLTVRIGSDAERDIIRYVMHESGCSCAAKAMLFACNAYRIYNERDRSPLTELGERYRTACAEHRREADRLGRKVSSLEARLSSAESERDSLRAENARLSAELERLRALADGVDALLERYGGRS